SSPSPGVEDRQRRIVAPLKVLAATYGSGERKVDLTARMQKGADGGLLVAFVEPALSDGKASGELLLRYRVADQEQQRTFRHREFVFLDVREPLPVPARGLVIREALYGAGIWGEGRMVDVKQRLRAQVENDRVEVNVKDLVSGISDPASGVSKVLIVRYALDGRDTFIHFDEHMSVRLGDERKSANDTS